MPKKDRVNDPVKDRVNCLTKTQKAVFDEIVADPSITYNRLCERLNIADSTVNRAISELKNQALISRKGSDKTGVWIINM